jgi:hypothetical protein
MFKKFSQSLMIFGLAALFTGAAALTAVQAHSLNALRVKVPFAFNVGDKTLPAGDYTVQEVADKALLLRNVKTQDQALVVSDIPLSPQNNKPAGVIFQSYGDQRFLSAVYFNTGGNGRGFSRSKQERALARAARESKNVVAGTPMQ